MARVLKGAVVLCVWLLSLNAWGEVIHFANGASARGRVERSSGDYVTIRTDDGRLLRVKRSLVVGVEPDAPTSRPIPASGSKPATAGMAIYDARPFLLNLIDRPAQPAGLAEGVSSAPLGQGYGQPGGARRSAKGRDTQDVDLPRRGHDLTELVVRTTGVAHWDHAFVMGRLPNRDYLAGEE